MPRPVTSMREVLPTVAKQTPNYAGMVQKGVATIYEASQESKIMNNLTKAQLEIADITNQFRVSNESDPNANEMEYNTNVQGVLNKYGYEVGTMYKGQWANNANKLMGQAQLDNKTWAVRQNTRNAVSNLNEAMENSYNLAFLDGQDFGSGEELDVNLLNKYEESKNMLNGVTSKYLGEETANELTKTHKENYMGNFLNGLAITNPQKAQKYIDNEDVRENLTPDNIKDIERNITIAHNAEQKNKLSNSKENLSTMFEKGPANAIGYFDNIKNNGKEFRDANGFDIETYDKMVSYGSTLSKNWDKLQEKINKKTNRKFIPEEVAIGSNYAFEAATLSKSMNISISDGKMVVKGEGYNSIYDLMSLKNRASQAYEYEALSKDKTRTYVSNANAALIQKLKDKDYDNSSWIGNTVEEKLGGLVLDGMAGSGFDKAMVFGNVYNAIMDTKGTPEQTALDSKSDTDLKRVEKYFNNARKSYMKIKDPSSVNSKAVKYLSADGVSGFNEDGDENAGENIDNFGGFELEIIDGIYMNVMRDSITNKITLMEEAF